MRTVEILSILGTIIGAFASGLVALERRLIKKLKSSGAISKDKAIGLTKLSPLSRWRLNRLTKSNAIIKTELGAYYFNEGNFRILRIKRVTATIIFLVVSISAIIILHG